MLSCAFCDNIYIVWSHHRDPNTWTIILSDHGHTRTKFGQTEDGLLERYNPLLFMIVPQNVAQLLGKKTMENLSTNQRRLLTTLDVHKALMTLHQESNTRSEDFRMSGVFSKIPSNRSCSDLPLMPLARCQCVGSEEMLKDNSPSHVWLAEFALGTLNGFIQQQYSKGKAGNCYYHCPSHDHHRHHHLFQYYCDVIVSLSSSSLFYLSFFTIINIILITR